MPILDNANLKKTLDTFLGSNSTYTLVFQRTVHGNNPGTFHTMCSTIGPNVSLYLLDNGWVVGGYTTQSWNSTNTYKSDPSAFLFRLSEPARKIPLINATQAVYDHTSYFPAFGAGHDLVAGTSNVTTNLGNSYSPQPEGGYFLLGTSSRAFQELEVYKVEEETYSVQTIWGGAKVLDDFIHNAQMITAKIQEIRRYEPPSTKTKAINIIFCGFMGHGKSALLSSIVSALEQNFVPATRFSSSNASVTLNLFKWKLTNGICLWDCPGEAEIPIGVAPYHNGEHLLIDNGRIPAGFAFQRWPITIETSGVSTGTIPFSQKMHCRMWVLRAKFAGEEAVLKRIRIVLDSSSANDLPCGIVVTGIDEIDPHLMGNPEDLFRSTKVNGLLQNIASKTGVPLACIVPVINYVNYAEPGLNAFDGILLLALDKMRKMAEAFLRRAEAV